MESFTKKALLFLALALSLQAKAQSISTDKCLYIYNKEYDVFLKLDLTSQGMTVAGHELYGPIPGYLGKTNYTFYWIILSAEKQERETKMQLINDYGSEDLEATLLQVNDTLFQLHQEKGSIIRLPNKGKWQKLPKKLIFRKK